MGPTTGVKAAEVSVAEYAKAGFAQSWDEIQATFNVNTTAVLFTAYAFLELLDAGNKKNVIPETRSQILVTSSIAGFNRMPDQSMAYKTSKAATTHLVKNLSSELVPFDIRCNALAPGRTFNRCKLLTTSADMPLVFPSDLAVSLISHIKTDPSKEGAVERSFVPATRLGSEEDMAGMALFLASRAGSYMNGLILTVDGGRLSQLPSTY